MQSPFWRQTFKHVYFCVWYLSNRTAITAGCSYCWKELCDETLSQPSSPSNAVANIVKINKQKTPNKQIDRDFPQPTASHWFYLLFSENTSTEIFRISLIWTLALTATKKLDEIFGYVLRKSPRSISGSSVLSFNIQRPLFWKTSWTTFAICFLSELRRIEFGDIPLACF